MIYSVCNGRWALLFSFLLVTSSLMAQSVSTTVIENNPDARKIFLSLNPFNAQYYDPNTNIGIDASVLVLIGSKFQAEANIRRAYLDSKTSNIFAPKSGLKKASQFFAGAAYNLYSSLSTRRNKVVLSSGAGKKRNTTSVTYIRLEAETRRIFAIRGGIQQFHNNVVIDNDITAPFTDNDILVKNASGTLVYIKDTLNFETINYIVNSSGFYAGVNWKTIRHLIVDVSGYGQKKNRKIDDLYLDVLFCPSVNYSIRPNEKQTTFEHLDFNISENKRKTMGWRFGWNFLTNHSAGLMWKLELGQQPGRPDKSFFLSVGFGMNFGLKLGSK